MRILIVEGDPASQEKLCSWLPSDMVPVTVRSAGRALCGLRMHKRWVYAGIVLDHDLNQWPASESALFPSGRDVVKALIRDISRDVPILITDSSNEAQLPAIYWRLHREEVDVDWIPTDFQLGELINEVIRESFKDWADHVRRTWESRTRPMGVKFSISERLRQSNGEKGHI